MAAGFLVTTAMYGSREEVGAFQEALAVGVISVTVCIYVLRVAALIRLHNGQSDICSVLLSVYATLKISHVCSLIESEYDHGRLATKSLLNASVRSFTEVRLHY
jgi:hypothetical protein